MRAYFFVNSWLSGIQKGIQVAHCVAEMADSAMVVESWAHDKAAREANPERINAHDIYCDWINDKTIIVLEGGSHKDLKEIAGFFEPFAQVSGALINPYPWKSFSEDEESLGGAMTCVGIIVPPKIYEAAKAYGLSSPYRNDVNLTSWELKLIDLINSKELAR